MFARGAKTAFEDPLKSVLNSFVLSRDATMTIKPDLLNQRPVFLEAGSVVLEEGSKLVITPSATPVSEDGYSIVAPVLKVKLTDKKGSFVNKAELSLDGTGEPGEAYLFWRSDGPNDYLLVYLRPGTGKENPGSGIESSESPAPKS
ncbi:MAG: hypothetical protein LBF41_07940 [Deltaproteobacteria bacterium]|jgi:hypothetical protein|nr:hypothetical protein [Deltaproteobacteria bacterium]